MSFLMKNPRHEWRGIKPHDKGAVAFHASVRVEQTLLLAGMAAGLLVFILAGCPILPDDNGETMQSAISLNLNTWAVGELAVDKAQWFQFTATAAVQYIHIVRGTVSRLYVQLYDRAGVEIGDPYTYHQSSGTYDRLNLSNGKKYYLKVSASDSGAYKIAFTESADLTPDTVAAMASAPALNPDTWEQNELTVGEEHWYTFTATAETQYIHVFYGTLTDLYLQLYNSEGEKQGDSYRLSNKEAYKAYSLIFTIGAVYYLKVWPYSSSGSGSYKVAFNTSANPPS